MKLLIVAFAGAALVFAPPGHADPDEVEAPPVDSATFAESLKQVGITFADPAQAVAAAHTLCDLAATGESSMELLTDITTANPKLSVSDAARFATIAAKTYCPDQLKTGKSKG